MKITRIQALIVLIILAAVPYHQLYWYPLINIDDGAYLTENIMVQKGLGWESIKWAFTTLAYGNWSPVTWLSHTLDYSLFGLSTAGHHMMNLGLHVLGSWVFYLAMLSLSGESLLALCMAVVYLLHPQHVEPVAWIASRKDILSGLFWNTGLLMYARYALRPSIGRYLCVLLAVLLGLMSKSVLVAFPLVALVLDFWPLKRFEEIFSRAFIRSVLEKVPLFALSGVFVLLTMFAQKKLGATEIFEVRAFYYSLLEPSVNYWLYLREFFVPLWLMLPYPLSEVEVLQGLAGWLGILVVTVFALSVRKPVPWLLTGWLYFLLSLASYAGFVRVGIQSMADRWMYVPLGGLAMLSVGVIVDVWRMQSAGRHARKLLIGSCLLLLALCCFQVRLWSSPEVLFERTVRISSQNFMAHIWLASHYQRNKEPAKAQLHYEEVQRIYPRASNFANLAKMLEQEGQSEKILDIFKLPESSDPVFYNAEAARYFYSLAMIPRVRRLYKERFGEDPAERGWIHSQEYLRLAPDNVRAYQLCGMALLLLKRQDESRPYFEKSVEINPYDPAALHNLGMVYFREGDLDKALSYLHRSLEMGPGMLDPFIDITQLLMKSGDLEKALGSIRQAVDLMPGSYKARNYLGTVLLMQKKYPEAREVFQQAIEINKEGDAAYAGLGAALFQEREYMAAYESLKKGVEINPESAQIHSNLGAASIQIGRLDEGKWHLQEALRIDPRLDDTRRMLAGFK